MGRWFRVDDGVVDDPKMQRLPDRLFRAAINLWCITSQNGGNLPPIGDIAFKLRMTDGKAQKLLDEMRAADLIEDDENGTRPHNWNGRQFKSDVTDPTAAERQRRKRDKDRNANRDTTVTDTVTVTPPRTETEQNRTDVAPDGASAAVKLYAFEDGVIRLTSKDFEKWKASFTHIDVGAELLSASEWLAREHGANWFHAAKGLLAKRNREAKQNVERVAKGSQLPLTPTGERWPDGIT